jgi:anti-sigma B factor antagonist
MAMNIHTRQVGNALVVGMEGRLDTQSAGSAHDEMLQLVQANHKYIVVNLENLDFVSSAGLRVFLRASKLLSTAGGELRLCCANERVANVIRTAGFDSLLHLYASEEKATQGF